MTISIERWIFLNDLPTIYHSSSISGCAVRAVRMSIGSIPIAVIYGDISLIGKALDCDSSRYRFKSYISPQFKRT